MIKFYNKIVRDGMQEVIAADSNRAAFCTLTGPDLIAALERKLTEEVAEYMESRSVEELADVHEVLYALVRARGIHAEVAAARSHKFSDRGGFDKGLYLLFADIRDGGQA